MNDATALKKIAEDLCAKGRISAEDVLRLCGEIFPDGVVCETEAMAVFQLDHSCSVKDTEWTRFYVDALTDYFLWQSAPRGYVSEEQAAQLIEQISRDGHIDAMSELELLVNIVHWCTKCPDSLALIALGAIRESILTPETACYGSNRPPAIIASGDVDLIRKIIYAPGSPGGFTVTQQEAELLTELDRATSAEDNAPTWPDLFAKAVANALMFPRGAPVPPNADEALRREGWLKERPGVGRLMQNFGKAISKGDTPFAEAVKEVDVFGTHQDGKTLQQEVARIGEVLSREAIDADEAHWLIGEIGGTANITKGAIQLLQFIKRNSPSIHPSLEPLFSKAGL